MKILAFILFSVLFINSYASCLDSAFSNGVGHLNNTYHLDEPPTCCGDLKLSAKQAIGQVLKEKLNCSDREVEDVLSRSIECLGNSAGVCQLEVGIIVIQVAIEHGAQPYTHIIFNDNH